MKILILGAKGRFGRHALQAALCAGHEVIAFARSWVGPSTHPKLTHASGNAHDPEAIVSAGQGADVVLNALNPQYEAWARDLLPLTHSVLEACERLNIPQLAVGNLYAYGKYMPARLATDTRKAPSNPLAQVRYAADQAMAKSSVPTLLFRGGDFLEGQETGNWYDTHMTRDVVKGRFAYPGPTDQPHAFAYLPDMAQAAVELMPHVSGLRGFEEVLFPGYTLTGAELCEHTAQALGQPLKMTGFPWLILRAMSLASPRMRGVVAMSYLWRRPHEVDGSAFDSLLPSFRETPVGAAFAEMIATKYPAPNHEANLTANPAPGM